MLHSLRATDSSESSLECDTCQPQGGQNGMRWPTVLTDAFSRLLLSLTPTKLTGVRLRLLWTRMHSRRMRTARLLSVSPSIHCLGGVPGPGGRTWFWGVYLVPGGVPGLRGDVPGPRGCTWSRVGTWSQGECTWSWGVYMVWGVPGPRGYLIPGGVPAQVPPPVNRMTDRCKNITLPQTSFAGGNKPGLGLADCFNYIMRMVCINSLTRGNLLRA